MKCLFLYNPNSGKGKIEQKLPRIRKKLRQKYDEVECVATKSAEDLSARVRSADCDVIVSGGDGTFHAALQGAEGKTLGYLPSGTVNDVARSLHLPRRLNSALDVILHGRTAKLDFMRAGRENIAYVAAAGAFTEATYNTPQAQKKAFGQLAYAMHAIRNDLPLPVFHIKLTCDGVKREEDAVLVLVLNGVSVAGFPVNKKGSMRDGKMEIALIRQVRRPNFLRRLSALFSLGAVFLFGIRVRKKDVLFLQGEHLSIQAEKDLVWDLDGERGPSGDLDIKVISQSYKLYVPHSKYTNKII